ncbi:MAG: NAD(P)H-dependent oxidoreductase [Candidatus Microthrix subdominans]|nr:NAD(P)H-dependent oxidoreductase [Candidatus Microthrix sp.]HMS49135.1 NAD(P)H-dependent oxidoreductase [Candidatus Microthrix sp.]
MTIWRTLDPDGPGLGMARLLVIHHTPSPDTHAMLHSVCDGATAAADELGGDLEVVLRPALAAVVPDVLDADGYLLGTPANFGYMSGALKHFFDTVYYPCLDATRGRPWGLWVHGNNEVDGAALAVQRIVTGLGWSAVRPPVLVVGSPTVDASERLWELGAVTTAAVLESCS